MREEKTSTSWGGHDCGAGRAWSCGPHTSENKQTYNSYLEQQVSEHGTRGGSKKNNHKTQTHKLTLKAYTASHTLSVSILVEL